MLLKLFVDLSPPNSWFPMSCCCCCWCCWCSWPSCDISCALWFIPIRPPTAIALFAIAALIPWPNLPMAPIPIPPIPELFATALPGKQLTPLTPGVSPFCLFTSFPDWQIPFIGDTELWDIIKPCKILWTELWDSLGSGSWSWEAGGCMEGMLDDVVGELSWFVFWGAGIILLLDVVGIGEGKEVEGLDWSELVELTLGIAALPPLLYRLPLLLFIGWSCIEFIEFCKSPAAEVEGADVEGAQLRELCDVASPLAEAAACTAVIGAELWPLWFELWGTGCCSSGCCCWGWRGLAPEGVLRGKFRKLSARKITAYVKKEKGTNHMAPRQKA